jgi:hypothetical protein
MSARNLRAQRSRGQEPRCRRCQHPEKPVDEVTMEKMRAWWIERYSVDELREIGRLLGWVH